MRIITGDWEPCWSRLFTPRTATQLEHSALTTTTTVSPPPTPSLPRMRGLSLSSAQHVRLHLVNGWSVFM